MRAIIWNKNAINFVKGLGVTTRQEIGALLLLVQRGVQLSAPQSRPMKIINKSAYELRIKDKEGIYRIIYVLSLGEKIYIPSAFTKKSTKTPKNEIDLAIKRIRDFKNENN